MAFDPMVANPGRLEILTALAAEQGQEFVRLRRRTGLTDGNLASHARRLQSAGMISVEKQFRGGKPVTSYLLTHTGKTALQDHIRTVMAAVSLLPEPVGNGLAKKFDVEDRPRAVVEAPVVHRSPSDEDDWVD